MTNPADQLNTSLARRCARHADGKEFVMIRLPQTAAPSTFVVLNWQQLRVSRAGSVAER